MASLVFLWGEAQLRNSGYWLGLPLRLRTDQLSDAFVDNAERSEKKAPRLRNFNAFSGTQVGRSRSCGLVRVKKQCFAKSVGDLWQAWRFFPGGASSGDFAWLADGRV